MKRTNATDIQPTTPVESTTGATTPEWDGPVLREDEKELSLQLEAKAFLNMQAALKLREADDLLNSMLTQSDNLVADHQTQMDLPKMDLASDALLGTSFGTSFLEPTEVKSNSSASLPSLMSPYYSLAGSVADTCSTGRSSASHKSSAHSVYSQSSSVSQEAAKISGLNTKPPYEHSLWSTDGKSVDTPTVISRAHTPASPKPTLRSLNTEHAANTGHVQGLRFKLPSNSAPTALYNVQRNWLLHWSHISSTPLRENEPYTMNETYIRRLKNDVLVRPVGWSHATDLESLDLISQMSQTPLIGPVLLGSLAETYPCSPVMHLIFPQGSCTGLVQTKAGTVDQVLRRHMRPTRDIGTSMLAHIVDHDRSCVIVAIVFFHPHHVKRDKYIKGRADLFEVEIMFLYSQDCEVREHFSHEISRGSKIWLMGDVAHTNQTFRDLILGSHHTKAQDHNRFTEYFEHLKGIILTNWEIARILRHMTWCKDLYAESHRKIRMLRHQETFLSCKMAPCLLSDDKTPTVTRLVM